MTNNVGTVDRLARAVLGLVLLYFAFFSFTSTLWTAVAAIVGIVLLATAALSMCPLYRLLGINTCKV